MYTNLPPEYTPTTDPFRPPAGRIQQGPILNQTVNQSQLKELFEEFKIKDNNRISAKEFLDYLNKASMSQSCTLLVSKLRDRGDSQLSEAEFYDLFNFDFTTNEDNLKLVISKFDELGNNNQSISVTELNKINNLYNLGLTSNDIDVMIQYGGSGPGSNSISLDQLKNLITGN